MSPRHLHRHPLLLLLLRNTNTLSRRLLPRSIAIMPHHATGAPYSPSLLRSLTSIPTSKRYHGDPVRIVEVSPRDGLQNEPSPITLQTKLELLSRLQSCGLRHIEAGSFVSPKWVPAMAESPQILQALTSKEEAEKADNIDTTPDAATTWSWLVPNTKGLETFFKQHPTPEQHEIAVFASASEGFSQKNLNTSVASSLERFRPVVEKALERGYRVRGYVSMIISCPYSGHTPPSAVARVVSALLSMGCYEVSLGDTNGVGTPRTVSALLHHLTHDAGIPVDRLAGHFHDTYGMAIVNAATALEGGVRVFDASAAGLGGCPYAKGATGNVATEDLVWFLEGVGCETGVDLEGLVETGEWVSKRLARGNGSRVGAALAKAMEGGGVAAQVKGVNET